MADFRDRASAPQSPKDRGDCSLEFGITLEDYRRIEAQEGGRTNLCWSTAMRKTSRQTQVDTPGHQTMLEEYAARRWERGPASAFPL